MIDRKFKILAVNPCNGKHYTEQNAVLLCAKDKATVPALEAYLSACHDLGCDATHLESVTLLIDRIIGYQKSVESRIPDTDLPCEIERCIEGKNLD